MRLISAEDWAHWTGPMRLLSRLLHFSPSKPSRSTHGMVGACSRRLRRLEPAEQIITTPPQPILSLSVAWPATVRQDCAARQGNAASWRTEQPAQVQVKKQWLRKATSLLDTGAHGNPGSRATDSRYGMILGKKGRRALQRGAFSDASGRQHCSYHAPLQLPDRHRLRGGRTSAVSSSPPPPPVPGQALIQTHPTQRGRVMNLEA